MATDGDAPPHKSNESSTDDKWWRDYMERKLELEREKLRRKDERHRDLMNSHKMTALAQEKSTKIKVDAITDLTGAITKLLEAKSK